MVLFSEMLVTTIRYCSVRAGSHPLILTNLVLPQALGQCPLPVSSSSLPSPGQGVEAKSDLDQSCQLSVYHFMDGYTEESA